MESLQKQFTTGKQIFFSCNLGYYLNREVQISNFISETQILEPEYSKTEHMKKLGIETKFTQVENESPNTSCFFRKTFAVLENKISNTVDLLKT